MRLRSAILLLFFALATRPASGADRDLINSWAVRNEVKLPAGVKPALVKDHFPSFYEYLDTVLFHPTAGYYSSGRVDFTTHYRTFPIALSPTFGNMIAEQLFQMWSGMRKAGTLRPAEKFTIAEFGAGDGALAESILGYIDQQAATNPDARWREFQAQAIYASYDRSPALNELQRKRNSRFGARFEARPGDATNPGATIKPGSLKGVVLSNELPDCFSVHKVILDSKGSAEIAFTVPSLLRASWAAIQGSLPPATRQLIVKDDSAIFEKLFGGRRRDKSPRDRVYLSRAGFSAILSAFQASGNYEGSVTQLRFQELYVPVSVIPELAAHVRKYARAYAYALTRSGRGMVTYINVDEGKFIRGAGAALKAGYVITIDYGSNWDGILSQDFEHLRMFGPTSATEHADPYQGPTLNDMTTDVNFSHIAAEGESVGLRALYFGPQHALQKGTSISLEEPPFPRGQTEADLSDYQNWAGLFYTWEVYKLLVQQKAGTDPEYNYPAPPAEPLPTAEAALSPAERRKMNDIAKRLAR